MVKIKGFFMDDIMGIFDDNPTQKNIEDAKARMLIFPIIIPASKRNWIFIIISFPIFFVSYDFLKYGAIEGCFTLAFAICMFLLGFWLLSPNGPSLTIDKDGFEHKTLFKTIRISWNDIKDLGTWKHKGNKFIVWNWNDKLIASGERKVPMGSSFFGFHSSIRNFYAIEHKELLALMFLVYEQYKKN